MINIFENTLLKWIFRQGSDTNRKNIVLDTGEPGFTTDTNRLWVGDGSTNGGILVGNLFKGSNSNITTLSPCEHGDLAYNTSTKKLFRLIDNDGSNISDWEEIGGVYTPLNNTIDISNNNEISVNVNALSGFTINPLYARYNGSTQTVSYQKNVSGVNRIAAGHYAFNYGPLETSEVIPNIQIFGENNLEYVPRIITLSNSSCQIKFQNLSGGTVDADVFFSIIR
jgi:hypothetical protein